MIIKRYEETIVIAKDRQCVQLILNTAINMITHMYIILYICMHTFKYRIPNLLLGLFVILLFHSVSEWVISITILLLYVSINIILNIYVRNL